MDGGGISASVGAWYGNSRICVIDRLLLDYYWTDLLRILLYCG